MSKSVSAHARANNNTNEIKTSIMLSSQPTKTDILKTSVILPSQQTKTDIMKTSNMKASFMTTDTDATSDNLDDDELIKAHHKRKQTLLKKAATVRDAFVQTVTPAPEVVKISRVSKHLF